MRPASSATVVVLTPISCSAAGVTPNASKLSDSVMPCCSNKVVSTPTACNVLNGTLSWAKSMAGAAPSAPRLAVSA
ncbi:MAG: hypothetical protein R3A44_23120 [Caldilineaceae bacterium]